MSEIGAEESVALDEESGIQIPTDLGPYKKFPLSFLPDVEPPLPWAPCDRTPDFVGEELLYSSEPHLSVILPSRRRRPVLDLPDELRLRFPPLHSPPPSPVPPVGVSPVEDSPPPPPDDRVSPIDPFLSNALRLAHVSLEDRRYGEAQAEYESILEVSPNLSIVHRRLGLVHLMQDSYENAINHLKNAVSLSPNDALSCFFLGWSYLSLYRSLEDPSASTFLLCSQLAFSDVLRLSRQRIQFDHSRICPQDSLSLRFRRPSLRFDHAALGPRQVTASSCGFLYPMSSQRIVVLTLLVRTFIFLKARMAPPALKDIELAMSLYSFGSISRLRSDRQPTEPLLTSLQFNLALALFESDMFEEAVVCCDELLKTSLPSTLLRLQGSLIRGRSLLKIGSPQLALEQFQRTYLEYPKNHEAFYGVALSYYHRRSWENAIGTIGSLKSHFTGNEGENGPLYYAKLLVLRVSCLRKRRNFNKAQQAMTRAIQKFGDVPEVWLEQFELLSCLSQKKTDPYQALAVGLATLASNIPKWIRLLARIARDRLDRGQVASAIGDLSSIISKMETGEAARLFAPRDVAPYYRLRAQAYYQNGRMDFCVGDCTSVINLVPLDRSMLHLRGLARRDLGVFDLAAEDFTLCLGASRDVNLDVWILRADSLKQAKKWKLAIRDYTRLLHRSSFLSDQTLDTLQRIRTFHLRRAQCYARLTPMSHDIHVHHYEVALHDYEAAKSFSNSPEDVERIQAEIDALCLSYVKHFCVVLQRFQRCFQPYYEVWRRDPSRVDDRSPFELGESLARRVSQLLSSPVASQVRREQVIELWLDNVLDSTADSVLREASAALDDSILPGILCPSNPSDLEAMISEAEEDLVCVVFVLAFWNWVDLIPRLAERHQNVKFVRISRLEFDEDYLDGNDVAIFPAFHLYAAGERVLVIDGVSIDTISSCINSQLDFLAEMAME